MRGRNTLSSLLHAPLDTAGPPRKRPRTAEREASPATTDSSRDPSPRPKSSGAVAASSNVPMDQSTSPGASRPRSRMSMSHLGDVLNTSGVLMGAAPSSSVSSSSRSARRSDASRTVADESESEAEWSNATLLQGSSSIQPGARAGGGGEGDADGAPQRMKGRGKGKARASNAVQGEGSDGEGAMVWESIQSDTKLNSCTGQVAAEEVTPGGAGVIANSSFPTQRQPTADGADGRDFPAHEGGQDRMEEPTVRDGEFYINSADCVLRVDNTLFKVHRYFLGRDSSAFQHMFDMPAQSHVLSQNMEGCSDENPIRLYGESVERFRALLSVIYDLPLQLQIYNTPAANVDRLLTIAEMTNKYHFASIETWAVDALYNVISGLHGPPQPQYELGHCSSAWMKRLLEVALLCGHTALRNYVAERWVERIVARDLRPVHALEIADRSGIRRLQGYAYYVQLLEMGDGFDPGVVEDGKQYSRSRLGATVAGPNGNGDNGTSASAPTGTPASLTREQRQRLLSGAWSLSRLWETLRTTPPAFQRPDGCTYHQQGCVSTWRVVWRDVGKAEGTLKHAAGDVLGRLRAMEEQLFMHADLSCALTPQCKRGALVALKTTIREVQEGLADHFADLTLVQAKEGTEANAAEGSS
ncbi:hypothetical protein GSI_15109 [Ganoderma sinense ZZ0214-1]|uniref:BTB domain-containing protein n=1 Tax=Ganoderma sinense ZZ0214-1 TaxID=1077348 RepID=A0A2G8RLM5_9APHY|nr:hypothetical protein GSI_15109 [Ganoderma sinense ZZ0214-1]